MIDYGGGKCALEICIESSEENGYYYVVAKMYAAIVCNVCGG